MRLDGRYVHSRIDPVAEAARVAARAPAASCYVLFGYGLGYLLRAFVAVRPATPVVLVDPDGERFLSAITLPDGAAAIDADLVSVAIGVSPDAVVALLGEMRVPDAQLVALPAVAARRQEYRRELSDRIAAYNRRSQINENTLRRFGRTWVRNFLRNVDRLQPFSLAPYGSAFSDLPGLLVAGGPTLDEVVPALRRVWAGAVTVAVDTSYPFLRRHGIEPDFVVVVDPQYWNTRHLDRLTLDGAVLVSESSTHPRVFRVLGSRAAMCAGIFPLSRYVEPQGRAKLGAGGSVATTAFDLLRFLGCTTIFVGGLDLGFPDGETHFRGSFFEERAHLGARRLAPVSTAAFRYLSDGGAVASVDYRGHPLRCDERMRVYRWWFENRLRMYPEVRLLSLSGRSSAIEGATHADESTVAGVVPRRDEIAARTARLLSREPAVDTESRLCRLRDELATVGAAAQKALVIIGRSEGRLSIEDRVALQECDHAILTGEAKDIVGFIIQGEIRGTLHSDGTDGGEALYRAISEAATYHIRMIDDYLGGERTSR